MKDETLSYEKYRIMMAKELRAPPDDINLSIVLRCVFRSIREHCEQGEQSEYLITIKDRIEEEAILSEYGQIIMKRIFDCEYPFENIIENYSDWYISVFLKGNE